MITTDICIIGAGPVGLFAVFEAGLLKMRCHLIDTLSQVGGQLSEIYPKKPIYDIPGYPEIGAQELIDRLMQQIQPFSPGFTLGERVESLKEQGDRSFKVKTNEGTELCCKVVVIAAGYGCFEPRKPAITNLEKFEGKGISYMIRQPEDFRGKQVVLAGGGDSALDWTIALSSIASELTLIHRGESFRGTPDSTEKVLELAKRGIIRLLLKSNIITLHGDNCLTGITVADKNFSETILPANYLIPLFGLSPKLGPIADWNLPIERSSVVVNTLDYSTGINCIYAIGDINTYPGKLNLILCGFHEAALMAQSAFKYVHPTEKLNFKYTTVYGVPNF